MPVNWVVRAGVVEMFNAEGSWVPSFRLFCCIKAKFCVDVAKC